jgi:tetratricopeptide (TPR) repeat protein
VPFLESLLSEGFTGGLDGSLLDGGPLSPEELARERAQDLVYDAWEAETDKEAVSLAWKALAVCSDCADAYVLLAELAASSPAEALAHFRRGAEAARRVLGEEVFAQDVGHFWALIETRSYMRALDGMAMMLWDLGEVEESIKHCWELLRLNPNDNQGVRHVLLPRLIEIGLDREARCLYEEYETDGMAIWLYCRVLLDFRSDEASKAAVASLREAMAGNPHVPDYLLGRKQSPEQPSGYFHPGAEDEAVSCVSGIAGAWEKTPGALEWLAAATA